MQAIENLSESRQAKLRYPEQSTPKLDLELVVVVERVAEIVIVIAAAEFALSFQTYRSREEAF